MRASGRLGQTPITIHLLEGVHYLDAPVVFTPADSATSRHPLVIAGSPGGRVVLSGGFPLRLDWQPGADGTWSAPVDPAVTTDQLFVNGIRQPMARYPNEDPTAQYFGGTAADCIQPARALRWAHPEDGFLHAMHRHLWGDFHYRITGRDAQGRPTLEGGWQNNRQLGMHGELRFVENLREELDAPGEWFLDPREHRLYFRPPQGVHPPSARFEGVRLRHLLEFRGDQGRRVTGVRVQDLVLTHTTRTFMDNREPLLRSDWTTYRGGAVLFDGAEACALTDCTVTRVGGNAVYVSGANRDLLIARNHITDVGASGVSLVGRPSAVRSPLLEYNQTQALEAIDREPGPRSDNFPARCRIEGNLIHHCGTVEKQSAGVNIAIASEISVLHNSIYDLPRAGINLCDGCFGGHRIEWNDTFDTVKETGDHGCFNSWGRDRYWNPDRARTETWVRQHPDMPRWDSVRPTVMANNRWRCDHGWDIDLDDGSSNFEIYNNLCLAGGIKLREGYIRSVHNNILVDYTFCPHVWYTNSGSTFFGNILWQDHYATAGMSTADASGAFDSNFVHVALAPGLAPATGLQSESRQDRHSLRADARFVNPLAGDYRVASRSPATRVGFRNFAMDRFGVEKPSLKALARTPILPGTLEAAAVRSGGWGRDYQYPKTASWLGATVKSVESDGEMSALGLGDHRGVVLQSVPAGSPAARLGLRTGDVVLEFNGPVAGIRELADRTSKTAARAAVSLVVWRHQAAVSLQGAFAP